VGAGELLSMAREKCRLIVVPEMGKHQSVFGFNRFENLQFDSQGINLSHVHTHSSKAGVLGRVAARRTPIIVHTCMFFTIISLVYQQIVARHKKICAPITDFFISVSQIIVDKAVAAGIISRRKNFARLQRNGTRLVLNEI